MTKEYLTEWIIPGIATYTVSCTIWGDGFTATITELWKPTSPHTRELQGHLVESDRTDGSYVMFLNAGSRAGSLTAQQKARLTTWLIDQRIQGDSEPEITLENLEKAIQRPSLGTRERAEKLLTYLANQSNNLSTGIDVQHDTLSAYAWSESLEWTKVVFLLNFLYSSGLIEHALSGRINSVHGLLSGIVTMAGFDYVSNLTTITEPKQMPTETSRMVPSSVFQENQFDLNERLVFMLSPFGEPFDTIFENHIKPTVENIHDLICVRADDIYDNQAVIDDIWRLTNEARIIIADFTNKNTNVFYETGLAHAIGKEVIPITQSRDDVPFDLKHRRYSFYEYTPEGIEQLKDELTNTINSILNRTKGS